MTEHQLSCHPTLWPNIDGPPPFASSLNEGHYFVRTAVGGSVLTVAGTELAIREWCAGVLEALDAEVADRARKDRRTNA